MLPYLIKSTICLVSIYLFYKVFLEREKMLYFNRSFLVGGLLFSILTPLITIDKSFYLSSSKSVENPTGVSIPTDLLIEHSLTMAPAMDISSYLVYFYVAIALLFLVRFLYRLSKLYKFAHRNIRHKKGSVTYVLIPDTYTPFTFMHCVFVPKKMYEEQLLADELLAHECTHAIQRHSWDIVWVELYQVFHWLNPIIPYYKKAIQHNHEFIADDYVLQLYPNARKYQQLLLENTIACKQLKLTSNLHFHTTKKRLLMMNKKTSWMRSLSRALLSIPLFTLLFFVFSNAAQAQEEKPETQTESKTWKDKYFEQATFVFPDHGELRFKSYDALTAEEKSSIPPPPTTSQDGQVLTPLPDGATVRITPDGMVQVNRSGEFIPPPPPPAPKAPEAPKAPPAFDTPEAPPVPPAPPTPPNNIKQVVPKAPSVPAAPPAPPVPKVPKGSKHSLKDSKQNLKESQVALEESERLLKESNNKLEGSEQILKESKHELEKSKQKLEASKSELKDSQSELKDAKLKLEKLGSLDTRPNTYLENAKTLEIDRQLNSIGPIGQHTPLVIGRSVNDMIVTKNVELTQLNAKKKLAIQKLQALNNVQEIKRSLSTEGAAQ